MSLPYCLQCSVCENSFDSRIEWLRHLPQAPHQDKARKECWTRWGKDEELRECVVVVFCSFPLSVGRNVEEVLEHFGTRRMNQCVADFVWWPERDKVGFMQFEGREVVNRVMKTLENDSDTFVGNKMVQLKRAVDTLQLEWKELLPPDPIPSRIFPRPTIQHPVSSATAGGLDRVSVARIKPTPTTPASDPPASSNSSSSVICPSSVTPSVPPSSCIPIPNTPYQEQFNSICKSVEIPEDEFKHALEIVSTIKQIFTEHHPSGRVLMLRNYFLRLRNTGSNILLIFAYIAENPADPYGFVPIGKAIQDSIFPSPKFQQILPGFKKKSFDFCTIGGTPYHHDVSGFRFNFITDPLAMGEAHLDLLYQYMCTFDPRVKPLLTLVYFWAKSHGIHIAEKNIPKNIYHSNCPEPVALEWLVMLFLIKEEIVPSVRTIIQRPHRPVLICEVKCDIGFSPDADFAKQWIESKDPSLPKPDSPEFLISVLTLLQKLFHFYSTALKEGSWLLNPKDGEVIKREGTRCHKSQLSPDETYALTMLQDKETTKEHLIINNHRIYMIHPLYITWRLSFCVETWTESTCENMWNTSQRLEEYINSLTANRNKNKTLDIVLAGSRQHSQEVQLELQCEMNQSLRAAIRTRVEQRKRKGKQGNNANRKESTNTNKKRKRCS